MRFERAAESFPVLPRLFGHLPLLSSIILILSFPFHPPYHLGHLNHRPLNVPLIPLSSFACLVPPARTAFISQHQTRFQTHESLFSYIDFCTEILHATCPEVYRDKDLSGVPLFVCPASILCAAPRWYLKGDRKRKRQLEKERKLAK